MRLAYRRRMHYALLKGAHFAHEPMKLRPYLDSLPRGGIVEFANRIGISTVYLSQLAAGQDDREPSPALCVVIERETCGAVPRQDQRKDWQDIWPELAEAKAA